MNASRTNDKATAAEHIAAHLDAHPQDERRQRAEELHEQARLELAALIPERDQLLTAIAAYEPPDVGAATRLGITWKQMAAIAAATTGVTEPWSSLQPEERAAAARAAGIPHPDGLCDKVRDVWAAYTATWERARAALAAVYTELRAAAAREVDAALAPITDPAQRRAAAEDIAAQASLEMAALKPERDQCLASAALHESREGLAADFGITHMQMRRIVSAALGTMQDGRTPGAWPKDPAAAAKGAGIAHLPDCIPQGIAAAQRYEAAEARRDAALARLQAAHEAVRTAGGRVASGPMERPDFGAIRHRATEELRAEFAAMAVTPEERLRRAADAVDQAEDEMAALLPERDQALASLAFFTTARAAYHSAGLSRQGMRRVLERALGLERGAPLPSRDQQPTAARAAGVEYVANAAEELPQIATAYEAAAARRTAAIEIRTAVIRTLNAAPYSCTQTRLAESIGRDVAIVNRSLNPAT
jgi:hypothetical protein